MPIMLRTLLLIAGGWLGLSILTIFLFGVLARVEQARDERPIPGPVPGPGDGHAAIDQAARMALGVEQVVGDTGTVREVLTER